MCITRLSHTFYLFKKKILWKIYLYWPLALFSCTIWMDNCIVELQNQQGPSTDDSRTTDQTVGFNKRSEPPRTHYWYYISSSSLTWHSSLSLESTESQNTNRHIQQDILWYQCFPPSLELESLDGAIKNVSCGLQWDHFLINKISACCLLL